MEDLEIRIEPNELPEEKEWEALKAVCVEYMEFLAGGDYHEDNDWDHYIYEAAWKLVYGPDAFEESNRLMAEQDKRYMEVSHAHEKEMLKKRLKELEDG